MHGLCHYCNYIADEEYQCRSEDLGACEPCRRLADIEAKVKEIRRMLVGLAKERQKLKEQANNNHDRFLKRFPVEIAALIFRQCIPEDAMECDLYPCTPTPMSTLSVPLLLSAVSRKWGMIARSTPRLWNTLTLRVDSKPLPAPTFVESLINRAGNLPLSINLYIPSHDYLRASALCVINALNQCSERWLHLKCSAPISLLSQLSRDGEDLPELRTLRLSSTDDTGYVYYDEAKALKLRPKQLRALSINEISISALDLDLQHLEELELGTTFLNSDCFEALRRAPCLLRFTFRADEEIDEEFLRPSGLFLHPKIQHLEVDDQGILYVEMFQHLLCPSLKTLMLNFNSFSSEIPSIVTFLKTSECSLQNLTLMNTELSVAHIELMCREITTLQHLSINLGPTSDSMDPVYRALFAHLAEFLIVDQRKEPRCLPALCSLTLASVYQEWPSGPSFWTVLPDIFGNFTGNAYSIEQLHRRSLKCVSLYVFEAYKNQSITKPEFYEAIGRPTLEKILWLKSEAGVQWKLQLEKDRDDILVPAFNWYEESSVRDEVE